MPAIWSKIGPIVRRVLDTGESVLNFEMRADIVGEPGSVHHALASYYPVRLDDEIIGVGMIVVDITDHFEAEAARNELTHSAIAAIAAAIAARDPYTAGHQLRVADISFAIATELGLDDDEKEGIRLAATIHESSQDRPVGSSTPS